MTIRSRKKPFTIDMQRSYGELEMLVQVRTAELVRVNELLRREIEVRRLVESEHGKLIDELRNALESFTAGRGSIPLCAYCKNRYDNSVYGSRAEPQSGTQRTENLHRDN